MRKNGSKENAWSTSKKCGPARRYEVQRRKWIVDHRNHNKNDSLKKDPHTQSPQSWEIPPINVALESGKIHIWRASLRLEPSTLQSFLHTLSEEEKKRADKFHFEKDRVNFIAARGLLRNILSRYLDTPADRLAFSSNTYGKPHLANEQRPNLIKFNMSHSGDLALYAIARALEVGIDIEQWREHIAEEDIAERFFSSDEVTALRSLPKHLQKEAFFNCWAGKEAYIKARGKGLSIPLKAFTVSLAPGESASLVFEKDRSLDSTSWSIRSLDAGPGYSAALVVKGSNALIKCWQWKNLSPKLQTRSGEE